MNLRLHDPVPLKELQPVLYSGMSQSRMPYQCVVKSGNVLVAARGSRLDSFDVFDGSLLSTWKYPSVKSIGNGQPASAEVITKLATQNSESSSVEIIVDASSPPAKKRKLSASEPADASQDLRKGKKKQNNRSDAVASGLEAPAVIALAVTNSGRHVIAVTGEDKTIRVFENVQEDGVHQLWQLSQRAMPKRPCALAITDDDSTIISADKFGDVYSLPLIPPETSEAPKSTTNTPDTPGKTFTPAANELTIHSQRNRKALENQRRQTNKSSEKSEPIFEHKLLLGHVSMLTDIALVTLRSRNYIITADRDEHIRVSRGIPQTHIIEGFCLGHTAFISGICIPADRPELLMSGGGDDELFVWEWESGNLVSKAELKKYASAAMQEFDAGNESDVPAEPLKIAVSGIYHTRQALNGSSQDIIVVTCEGVPALFTFILTAQSHLEYIQALRLPGNPLSVVLDIPAQEKEIGGHNRILVSIDTIHKPGSTTEKRGDAVGKPNPLQSYQFHDKELVHDVAFQVALADQIEEEASGGGAIGRVTNLLYNLENLRKREGDAQED